jgi:predicted PurR-regulated permease PerM
MSQISGAAAEPPPGGGATASRVLRTVYRTPPPWVRTVIIWVFVGLVGLKIASWAFHGLSSLIGVLFLAWLLSIAMEPAVGRLASRGMKRGLATALVLLVMAVLAIIFFAAFGKLLIEQLVQLIQALPGYLDQTVTWVNNTFNTNFDQQTIQDALNLDTSKLLSIASNIGGGLFGLVTSLVSLVFSGFMLLLFAYYMSADAPRLRATVSSWFPQRHQRVIDTVWGITVQKTGGYVFSRLVLAVLSAFFTGIFLFALHIPYWLPLAIWTGLVSQFIPTIGTYLGGALPVIIAALSSPVKGLLVLGFILIYQQVENYFFAPKITARTVNIHPAVAFGAVIGGGALFGAWGALVAIPVVAAIQSTAETYGRRYELIPEMQHEVAEQSTQPETVTEPTAQTVAQQAEQVARGRDVLDDDAG